MTDISKINRHENWFGFKSFYDYVLTLGYDSYVELGVWKGDSISYMAKRLKEKSKEVKIYGVDLFDRWDCQNKSIKNDIKFIYEIYNKNLVDDGVRDMIIDIKDYSWNAASQFDDRSVDFVFIDADHSYESVKKDIIAWMPKVKHKGLLAGHDYFNTCGVKEAVDELLVSFETCKNSCVWYKTM